MSVSRPNPELLLRHIQADEKYRRRGRLKIFLGYTSGVGKSFRMLDEARRRRARGEDVVVGAIQPVAPDEVQALLEKMEVIPLRTLAGRRVMDVDALLRRHPQVCVTDGLAYDNPPGSPHTKRWQDVEQLLDAGVSVIASLNLQYIEEYREQVEKITGKRVTETVPLSFIYTADEIEVVDAPPDFLLERISAAGLDYTATISQQQLSELREIALLLAADVVDRQLEAYLERHGIDQLWGAQERILVCITPRMSATKMIQSGRRNADRFHGELFVTYVKEPEVTPDEQKTLEAQIALARELHAQVNILEGEDPVVAIMDFARAHRITQIFIGHSRRKNPWHRLWGSAVDRLIRDAEGIDLRVFPN